MLCRFKESFGYQNIKFSEKSGQRRKNLTKLPKSDISFRPIRWVFAVKKMVEKQNKTGWFFSTFWIISMFFSKSHWNHERNCFHLIYRSTNSQDYLWYMILRGKKKKRIQTKIRHNAKFLPFSMVEIKFLNSFECF